MRNLLAKQPTIHQPIYLANPVFHPPISILHPFLSLNVPSSHPTPEPASGTAVASAIPDPLPRLRFVRITASILTSCRPSDGFRPREKKNTRKLCSVSRKILLFSHRSRYIYIKKYFLHFWNIIPSFLRFSLRLIFKLANQVINRHFFIFLSIYSFYFILFRLNRIERAHPPISLHPDDSLTRKRFNFRVYLTSTNFHDTR